MNRLPEADQPYCGRRAAPAVSADASAICRSMPLLALILSACIVLPPEGPSVMVLPGSGQRFEQFRADDAMCRNFASQAIGPRTPQSAAVDAGVASAALGTVIGAALGAAVCWFNVRSPFSILAKRSGRNRRVFAPSCSPWRFRWMETAKTADDTGVTAVRCRLIGRLSRKM